MLRGGLPGARWIDPENYHLTLRFIGDVDDALANDIASLLDGISRPAFDLRLDGLAAFGGSKPRAIIATAAPTLALLRITGRTRAFAQAPRRFARQPQVHAPTLRWRD